MQAGIVAGIFPTSMEVISRRRSAFVLPILFRTVLERWKRELAVESAANEDLTFRRRIEAYLDQGYGSCALRAARVATIVQESLLHFDSERYRLYAWVVMPNHVHILLTPAIGWSLARIMKDMKSFTSRQVNKDRKSVV